MQMGGSLQMPHPRITRYLLGAPDLRTWPDEQKISSGATDNGVYHPCKGLIPLSKGCAADRAYMNRHSL